MTRNVRRVRRLLVGDAAYRWTVGHQRRVRSAPWPPGECHVLTLRREGAHGRLQIGFQKRPGHLVPDGYLPSGAVGRAGGACLNLHQPGTVRALLDEALAHGWRPDRPEPVHLDGWLLFDAVAARRPG
ncbi:MULTISPECIES: hypothetical protein [Kitasatospora]|uniref:hypothetical protein n=1 Tax=Kitasatospora TaxID=2063 RepID=UPI000C70D6F1|nr:hypothetical protein [Kitasatospora sp. GP30]MDH6139061.1 hypothetical protein [Kitasatospora sp. GP30]